MVGSKDALKTHVLEAELEMPDNQTITGHNQTRAWVTRHYFYVIKFDRPYTVKEELPAEGKTPDTRIRHETGRSRTGENRHVECKH